MGMTDNEINNFNGQMRQQPWYQEWFAQRGLDPNKVKLNDAQREELKRLIEQRAGFVFPKDMKIDPAGNLNEKGGWAGLPGWAKTAIIGGATVASMGMIPGVPGVGGIFGGGGVPNAVPAVSGNLAPVLPATPGAVSGGGAAAGGLMSKIASFAKNPLVTAGGRMLAGAGQAAATNRGAEIEARLAHDQLNLAAQRERRDAETDAYRKSLFGQLAAGYQPSQRPDGAAGRNPNGFITDQARQAGQSMFDTAQDRMRRQDYPSITPYSQLPTQPGRMERFASYAAPALSLFDPRTYER